MRVGEPAYDSAFMARCNSQPRASTAGCPSRGSNRKAWSG
jgi:hypothetical protein